MVRSVRILCVLLLFAALSVYAGAAAAVRASPGARSGIEGVSAMAYGRPPGASVKAWVTAAALGRGVNFGNMLEGVNEGQWDPSGAVPVRDEFIDVTAAAGFTSVRLPVRWSNHAAARAPFTINDDFFERVESIVDKLLAKGLYVVLDMHHYHQLTGDHLDSGEFAVSAKVLDTRFVSLWQQIASRFSDKSDHLLFELYNEPHGRLTPSRWNALAARALSVVRQSNPTRIVVLAGANYDLSSLSLPNDANLIGTFHDYSPLTFTHQGAEWVSPPWPIGVTCCDDSQRAAAVAPIAAGKAWSDQWHYPVLLGEFGSYHFGDMNSRVAWTRFMREQAESRSISWCYWELAWGFGAYDPIGGGSIGVPGDPPSDQGGYWREPLKEALLGSS